MHSRLTKVTRVPRGFTLIELMIVVAIIAILAAIAAPAYQDYVTRSQVAEGFALSTSARVAVAEFYGSKGGFPLNNGEAGLPPPASINGRFVSSVSVGSGDGSIAAIFSSSANAKIVGESLVMTATDNLGSLRWQCGGLDARYLPNACR